MTSKRASLHSLLLACNALCLSACATTAVDTASSDWHEIRTARFRAVTDTDPEEAAALLQDLERFHRIVQRVTTSGEREGALPVTIWIASDAKTFRAWTKLNLAGLFMSSLFGNLAFVTAQDEEERDGEITSRHILFHEYTHYLMAIHGARIPSWYNEGLAEYLGATQITPEGAYRLGCPPRFRTRWTPDLEWLPIATIMESPHLGELAQGHSFRRRGMTADPYAQSWYAVHYFNATAERQRELARYLELIGSGTSGETAAKQAFGKARPLPEG